MKKALSYLSVFLFLCSCNTKEIAFDISINVFPNPCSDFVIIGLASEVSFDNQIELRIVDAKKNQIITQKSVETPNDNIMVDMSTRESGEYYAQLIINNKIEETDIFIKID